MRRLMKDKLWLVLAVAAGCAVAAPAAYAQGGTVEGHLREKATGAPVPQGRVEIVGTLLAAYSDDSGFYRIRRVPAGAHTVRAIRVGFQATTGSAQVEGAGTSTVDLVLAAAPNILSTEVITATGQQVESRSSGNATSDIRTDSVPVVAVTNFSTLLESRAAGVVVNEAGGTTGTGSRIRIRGENSVSLANDPLLIIDGQRVVNDAQSGSIDVGGQFHSRFDDLKPEDIEDVQVFKGPAATGLFGVGAASGAIVVTTKHGAAGRTTWQVFGEDGTLGNISSFPANYNTIAGGAQSFCFLFVKATGGCNDPVVHFSPLMTHSPFRTGHRQQFGGSVSGGTDVHSYYVSADYQQETGVYINNALTKENFRGNFVVRPNSATDITVSAGYLNSDGRLPQNDNNILGYLGDGLLGSAIDDANQGYIGIGPAQGQAINTGQDIQRLTPSVTANWRPLGWLTVTGTGGFDFANKDDNQLIPPGIVQFADDPLGNRTRNRIADHNYTGSLSAAAKYDITSSLSGTSIVGTQLIRELTSGNLAFGKNLNSGTTSLSGTVQEFAVSESNVDNRTVSAFATQGLAWRDRVFGNIGIRTDRNSAFGSNTGAAYYPTAQLAWVISDESFFPKNRVLTALKLRGAYGQSGLRPNFIDALTSFTPTAYRIASTQQTPGVSPNSLTSATNYLGNPNLKPERTTEGEGGFDASFANDRITFGATYFAKASSDELIARPIIPSGGTAGLQFINVGEVTNKGLELQLQAQILDSRSVSAALNLSYATLANKLVKLAPGLSPIFFGLGGNTQEVVPGQQLGVYTDFPYTYKDVNHDGAIEPGEITYGLNKAFAGNDIPTRTASVAPHISIFRWINFSALFDYRGGNRLYNSTEQFRCGVFANCKADYVAGTPLKDQAAAVANLVNGNNWGYFQDATFWKWREASLSITLPQSIASKAGAFGATLTIAERNIKTWTRYPGIDPEVNSSGQTNLSVSDFLTQPLVRYFVARLTLSF